ncbi:MULTISPECIES: hypothetical protein [Thalassospira]|uniref:hypothetical protein n=1 Tax=Thalassospira TaxID=168934 RepID=UPI0012EDD432|nr:MULTISPECIES: hypothetical protein [Thalassospira]MBR9899685.1 hypothetical protein [Rhodospirillales bacterium]
MKLATTMGKERATEPSWLGKVKGKKTKLQGRKRFGSAMLFTQFVYGALKTDKMDQNL